jgi:hypothetical protein
MLYQFLVGVLLHTLADVINAVHVLLDDGVSEIFVELGLVLLVTAVILGIELFEEGLEFFI